MALTQREIIVEGYERVVEFKAKSCGLHALIALHDTRLGPALGGTRAYPYASFDEALTDVLRLARGMTYKSALAQTGTGGGKSVIFLDPANRVKSKELLYAFADAVNFFEGRYICAEDVGMTTAELAIIGERTRFAVGLPHSHSSGDPSPYTTHGTLRGIEAVAKQLWGTTSLVGRKIAIQGLGAVGEKLAAALFWAGAHLIIADIDAAKAQMLGKRWGAQVVSPDTIATVDCDIFAPCALGGILNKDSIAKLSCKAVAGSANNQLLTPEDGERLFKKGILYAPDYVINSGGLINVCVELEERGYQPPLARAKVDRIYDFLLLIFKIAQEKGESPHKVADDLAEDNSARGIGKRTTSLVFR